MTDNNTNGPQTEKALTQRGFNLLQPNNDNGGYSELAEEQSSQFHSEVAKKLNAHKQKQGQQQDPFQQQQMEVKEQDISAERHQLLKELHPMKERKWKELYPVLAFLDYIKTVDHTALYDDYGLSMPEKYQKKSIDPEVVQQQKKKLLKRLGTSLKESVQKRKNQLKRANVKRKTLQRAFKEFDDPLKELGVGITSFHWLLTKLFMLFTFLYIIHIPVMNIFKSYNHFQKEDDIGFSTVNSLGNMGYSRTECETFTLIKGQQMTLNCATGNITDLVAWGLHSIDDSDQMCLQQEDGPCNSLLKDDEFRAYFMYNCLKKGSCTFKDMKDYLYDNPADGDCKLKGNGRIFVQYMCKQSPEALQVKKDQAQFCIYVGIVSALAITFFGVKGKKWVKKVAHQFDENTITPSDYVLILYLSPAQRKEFDDYYQEFKMKNRTNQGTSRGKLYYKWLKIRFKNLFSEDDRVKMLRIDPIFDNRKMISILKERGLAIKDKDTDKIKQLEDQLDENEQEQYETQICGGFITFETQQDVETAIKMCQLEPDIRIERPKEPSNYIWENLSIPLEKQYFNKIIVWIILGLCLCLAYKFQFAMIMMDQSFDKFEAMDCQSFQKMLLKESDGIQQEANIRYQKRAYNAWSHFFEHNNGKTSNVEGVLACFCNDKYSQFGFDAAYQKFRQDGQELTEATTEDENVVDNQICYEFVLEDKLSDYFHLVLSLSVIIINSIFYAIIVPLVGAIGLHRKTQVVLTTCMLIVICNFSDMVVLHWMVSMNLKEYDMPSFKGLYSDFEAGWYVHVPAQIFTTMVMFAVQPGIDFTVEILTLKLTNYMKTENKEEFTNSDQLTFLENYAGPEYIFFYKAAVANLTMMICFIFGGCMPAFYLIGMLAIAVQYTVDRVALAYHYRLPPSYSEILTLGILEMMSWIPLVTLCLMFWQYTNMQMFDNVIGPIEFQDEVRLSYHHMSNIKWNKLNTAQQCLAVTIVGIFSFHMMRLIVDWWQERQAAKQKQIEIATTPMPNFFDAIQEVDIEDYIEDYTHFRVFGFSFFNSPEKIQRLKDELAERKAGMNNVGIKKDDENMFDDVQKGESKYEQLSKKFQMIGDPCYQAYRCMDYKTEFNNITDEEEMHCKILLNLPMVPPVNLPQVNLRYKAPVEKKEVEMSAIKEKDQENYSRSSVTIGQSTAAHNQSSKMDFVSGVSLSRMKDQRSIDPSNSILSGALSP